MAGSNETLVCFFAYRYANFFFIGKIIEEKRLFETNCKLHHIVTSFSDFYSSRNEGCSFEAISKTKHARYGAKIDTQNCDLLGYDYFRTKCHAAFMRNKDLGPQVGHRKNTVKSVKTLF